LIENYENNQKMGFTNNNLFEIGRTFKQLNKKIYEEDHFAGIFTSLNSVENVSLSDWFFNKSIFEKLFESFGYVNITSSTPQDINPFYYTNRTVIFKNKEKVLGIFGELNPKIKQSLNLKGTIYIFELKLKELNYWQLNKPIVIYKDYSKYPSIIKDLSFSIQKETNVSDLKIAISNQIAYLKNSYFFDIYFDSLEKNKINIGLRLEFQSFSETLTNEKIEDQLVIIKNLLTQKFNIILN